MAKLGVEEGDADDRRRSIPIIREGDDGPQELELDEFLERADSNPTELFEVLMNGAIELNTQIEELNRKLATEKMKTQQIIKQRDQFAVQIAQMTIKMNSSSSTLADQGPAARKSTKIPDPPMLTDGKEPRFDDWLLLMNQKLKANKDHYDTPELRIAYVAGRCDGKARKHITPRLRDESSRKYKDSTDMLEHLTTIYNDPNRVQTAKREFRSLYMKVTDNFHDFLSEFLYLAAESGVSEDDWKDELHNKLITKLQELTISKMVEDGTFQEFSDFCSQTANYLKTIDSRNQRNRAFRNRSSTSAETTPANRSRATTPATADNRSRASTPAVENLDSTTRLTLMSQGRCFNCRQPGHRAGDCPLKTTPSTATELKNLEKLGEEQRVEDTEQGNGET